MGRPPPALLLLLPLLWLHTCLPASQGLRCVRCERTGACSEEECMPGRALCRTTALRVWEGGEELKVVERGCAHPEKTNRTMSYRTGPQIITLTETVCASDLCNKPTPGQAPSFPRGRYLECASCASSDMSCERSREQSLQCRNPGDQCLEVVSHRSQEGSLRDEHHSRGCGHLPGCPGPTGFHNNHTFHFLLCCNTSNCNKGPVLELHNLPPNGLQCHSCEGNSTHGCSSDETTLTDCRGPMNRCLEATGTDGLGNPSYTVRGCATASWCQSLHVAEAYSLTHLNVTCCAGPGCNGPASDAEHRRAGAPRPGPAPLGLLLTALATSRLWGVTLLWT
ncbi:urokinase plasminogen activator surface receptor isoform X1 [Lepus europaeus]|uniref:urokinase plasminogen activator surface receptor isoform X1 n=1 Tax=Lepus europaeus TaxID=9983 RepID=UPI002B49B44F|nr:urokinase plasminogen activator surface receptor isoform X1 [Lepus europaeus]